MEQGKRHNRCTFLWKMKWEIGYHEAKMTDFGGIYGKWQWLINKFFYGYYIRWEGALSMVAGIKYKKCKIHRPKGEETLENRSIIPDTTRRFAYCGRASGGAWCNTDRHFVKDSESET